jgi:hypothetical protein
LTPRRKNWTGRGEGTKKAVADLADGATPFASADFNSASAIQDG